MKIEHIDLIAVWGAVTGTIALLLQLCSHFSDRHRLKATVVADMQLNEDRSDATAEISFELRNVGRRICRIERIFILGGWPTSFSMIIFQLFRIGKRYVLFDAKTASDLICLSEGEKETVVINIETFSQLSHWGHTWPIYVEITDGRIVRLLLSNLRQIQYYAAILHKHEHG